MAQIKETNTRGLRNIDINIILYLVMLVMINIGFGVIGADFNLYILSMGMSPEMLGVVLSLTPFVQAFAAIPIGFLAEKMGTRYAFLIVTLLVGTAYFLRVFSPYRSLILLGSFMVGLVQAGYFVTQMPFITQYAKGNRNQVYALASIFMHSSRAVGNLLGGFLPGVIEPMFAGETATFRAILIGASLLIIAASIPISFLKRDKPHDTSKISLSPYLQGIDKNTVRFASVEFFLGTGLGFLLFFMNVIFVFYYNSSLEAFGTMSALLVIPLVFFVLIGPALAKRYNNLRVIVAGRVLVAVFAVLTIATRNPVLGAAAYIAYRAMIGLSTSLWLSFASSVSTDRSRVATSAWLEVTFQIGFAASAFVGGLLIARDAYTWLGIVAAVSFVIAAILTLVFFGRKYLSHNPDRT